MEKRPVEFAGVWKTFRRGERAGTLRDALPELFGRFFRRRADADLFTSLRDISFQVESGECVGVIGPNGAGKSTLLKLASRILRPNQGKVSIQGRVSALIEVGAGFHPDLTGRENTFLNGAILGMKRREVAKRFDEIVAFSGLEAFIDTPVKRYSSGMYARLGFSVAAFMEPQVLLIDEVLSVGDSAFGQRCEQKIREIRSAGAAVLFVSHNLTAVESICDRALLIWGGEIKFDGTPPGAVADYQRRMAADEEVRGNCPELRRLKLTLDATVGDQVVVFPGESLNATFEIVAEQPLDQTSIGLFVRDANDHEVYTVMMDGLGISPRRLSAGERLALDFRLRANLVPGVYSVGTIVEGRPEGRPIRRILDRTPNRARLLVSGAGPARGVANLFAEVTCADAKPAANRLRPLQRA